MNLKDLELDKNIKSIILDEIDFYENEKVEILIYLAKYIGIIEDIDKYYLLLGGRELITKLSFDNSDYMIENARKILKTLNQKKVYNEAIQEYDEDIEGTNIYVKKGNQYVIKENLSNQLKMKEKLYHKLLNLEIKNKEKKNKYAFGDDSRYGISINEIPIEIELLAKESPIKINMPPKRKNKNLKVKIDEIKKSAQELDDVLSKDKNRYREHIIKNNKFKKVDNRKPSDIEALELKGITNIVGQVGSGKSTFADALTNCLTKEKKRVMIICSSVNNIFEKYREYESLGKNVVPMIGTSMWQSHIEKAIDGKDYLKGNESKILTPACPLGGLIKESGISIRYGEEPCKKIYKFYENGNTLNKFTRYICPYYYKCPRTKIYKDIFEADIIITTSAGLSSMNIGISSMSLFQFALDYIDLIIIDEAESELNKLDQIFAPIISCDEYVTSNGNLIGEYYCHSIEDRLLQTENSKYKDYYFELEKAFYQIYEHIKSNTQGFSISQLKNPFSARSLIYSKKAEKLLSENIIKYLNEFIGKNTDKFMLKNMFDMSSKELGRYLKKNNLIKINLEKEKMNMIIFIIAVLYFEYNYREISNFVQGNEKLPLSTSTILSQRFEFQQRYIPMDPRGNIFKLQYKEDGNKSDLLIVKQFALGRSMYIKFPYLKLDSSGNPAGPNVLFLSGSSFAPGSFSNHINEKVDYILEAENYKTEFISNSYFEFYDCGINVSGSTELERNSNLKKLVTNCKELILDKLYENKKILMIVNSYDDAENVYKKLDFLLKDTEFNEWVSYLVPDRNNDNVQNAIKYSDICDFDKTNYKIFIAPAILIERGHNIVDIYGNSSFDVLMYLTRPMSNPRDYTNHICKVNGYIMSKYSNTADYINLEQFTQMMSEGYKMHNELEFEYAKLSDLPEDYQMDIMVTLFTMILQIFGRLCRVGSKENIKKEPLEVYFLDSSFKSESENGFDFLNMLVDYLEKLMNTEGYIGEISKSLYMPFNQSLKKGKNIYGTKKR